MQQLLKLKKEQRKDGKKKQCRKYKQDGTRCKMQTANKSGYCYYHDQVKNLKNK